MSAQRGPQPAWLWESQVRIPNAVQFRELGGECVLLNLATGTYFGLDQVGTRIWQLLRQTRKLHTVLRRLCEEYDVGRIRCRADLASLVGQLRAHGLVELVPPAGLRRRTGPPRLDSNPRDRDP